ncbi:MULTISPECIES: hypothetical protein [Methanohalophilus]|nr:MULTISPECIES: hypothetical protein [Methanohalophilus]
MNSSSGSQNQLVDIDACNPGLINPGLSSIYDKSYYFIEYSRQNIQT